MSRTTLLDGLGSMFAEKAMASVVTLAGAVADALTVKGVDVSAASDRTV